MDTIREMAMHSTLKKCSRFIYKHVGSGVEVAGKLSIRGIDENEYVEWNGNHVVVGLYIDGVVRTLSGTLDDCSTVKGDLLYGMPSSSAIAPFEENVKAYCKLERLFFERLESLVFSHARSQEIGCIRESTN